MPQCITCSAETGHVMPISRHPMCLACMEAGLKVYEKGKNKRDRDRTRKLGLSAAYKAQKSDPYDLGSSRRA